ncbi:MAG: LacI family transcriptional regulator [Pseudomonadota bacterium]
MTEKKQRPTLKTIAQMTGLAVPTVSRALSGAEDIGKVTRARVQQVAKEIGYVPNRAGVRLRTGRTHVVTMVLSTEVDVMNLTARLINSVAAGLRDTRYSLTITPYFPDEDPMKPVERIVESGTADAVILNQIQPEDPRVAFLMARRLPFATHGRTKWAERHDYVDFDNSMFAQIAVERMAARGRKSLLMLAPPQTQFYAQEMIRGATETAAASGLDFAVVADATSDAPSDQIEAAVTNHLRAHPQVDGIICASSASCMATVSAVEATGARVAEQIDLYAKEPVPFLTRFRPGILTQFEDARTAGLFLAKAVVRRIEDPTAPFMQKLEVPLKP